MNNTIDINALYEELDPLIVKTLNRICYYYRHTHPEDFADIRQAVRIDLWKALPKLLTIASDEQSLTRIIVNAIGYSFKIHYKAVKKYTDIEKLCLEGDVLLSIMPHNKDELIMELSELPSRIWDECQRLIRFRGREKDAINYSIQLLMNNRQPSKKLISLFFNVNNAGFFIDYSRVILSIAAERLCSP
jgi:hypothetical protein